MEVVFSYAMAVDGCRQFYGASLKKSLSLQCLCAVRQRGVYTGYEIRIQVALRILFYSSNLW